MRDESEDGGDDQPSVEDGIQGAAHLYDIVNRVVKGKDPKTRELSKHLDDVSMKDLIDQAGEAANQMAPAHPNVETNTSEDAFEVVIDTRGTPVDAASIRADSSGGELVFEEPSTGFEGRADPDVLEGNPPASVISTNQIATITVSVGGGDDGRMPAVDDGAEGDGPSDDGPTVEDILGDVEGEWADAVVEEHGDEPASEVLGDPDPDSGMGFSIGDVAEGDIDGGSGE